VPSQHKLFHTQPYANESLSGAICLLKASVGSVEG